MAQTQIKNLNPKHDAIIEWLIANPDKKLGDCARDFGISQAWLSVIIHSDVFQARYVELKADYREEVVIPLRDKLNGVAHRAAERLAQQVEVVTDPELLLKITGRLADKFIANAGQEGKGPMGGTYIQQNNYVVSAAELQEARDKWLAAHNHTAEGVTHDPKPALEHQAIPPGGETDLSQNVLRPAEVHQPEQKTAWEEGGWYPVREES